MGDGTSELHKWAFSTRTFQEKVLGTNAGATGVDDDIAARGFTNIGAWILGRNMFGPIRGPWPNEDWKGWWGENPPYHVPAFVLTHHPRKTLEMEGGTTFQFVTGGVREALALARDAAGAQDVRIGGGANTIRQFLIEGLIDKMHIAISPVLLGTGEPFFQGINLRELGYECKKQIPTELATHVFIGRGGE